MLPGFSLTWKGVLSVFLFLLAFVLILFVWAKSPNWPKEEYAQIRNFQGDQSQEEQEERDKSSDTTISLLTYNIGYLSGLTNNKPVRGSEEFYQKNLDGVLSRLRRYRVDVLAVQEIDFDSTRSYYVDQFEEIGEGVNYKNGAMVVSWDKSYVPFPYFPPSVHFGKMVSGQAIFSDYEITEQERVQLADVESQPYYYSAIYLKRLAQRAVIKVGGRDVTLLNVHTEAFDAPTRRAQILFLKEWFLRLAETMPVIMMGDFNSDPYYTNDDTNNGDQESGESAAIWEFYNDPRIGVTSDKESLGGQERLTYPSDSPVEQLDYIFFSSAHFELVEGRVLSDFGQISDHLPVYAKLRLK